MLVHHDHPSVEGYAQPAVADRARQLAQRLLWPAMLWALAVGSRLLVSRDRRGYVLWPDEPAQLAFARFVAGGARWNMHNHSTWKPGYGLLVGLLGRATSDRTDIYRVAMITNALLAGAAACVLYGLARRLTDLSQGGAALAAGVAVMLPGSLFVTNFAWSEPLTVAALLGSTLAMIAFDAQPTVGRGFVAGGVAAAGFASHTRLLPLLGIVVALAVIAARRSRLSRRDAISTTLWCASLFLTVTLVSRALIRQIWNEPFERNSYGGVLGQLAHVHEALVAMIGQAWYLIVSTGGLAVAGMVGLVGAARSSTTGGPANRRARAARVTLAVIGVEFAISGVFMAGRWRGDHVVYGRYNDAFVGVLVAVGVHTVVRCVRHGAMWRLSIATAGMLAVAWFALDRLRGRQLVEGGTVDLMVLGLQAFGDRSSIPLGVITVAAIGIVIGSAGVIQLAGRRWAPISLICVAVSLLWVGNRNANDVAQVRWTYVAAEPALVTLSNIGALDDAAYYLPPHSDATGQMMRYQSVLPHTRFTVIDSILEPPSSNAVFAPSDSRQLVDAGYHPVWRDPAHDIVLWQHA